jgi:hypothetical protein
VPWSGSEDDQVWLSPVSTSVAVTATSTPMLLSSSTDTASGPASTMTGRSLTGLTVTVTSVVTGAECPSVTDTVKVSSPW